MCGIDPVWASEIEPYPIAVTRSRFPTMKHLGDISKINGADIEPVDVITFGSPCQDLSVAGKRVGLEGARSGLFMEAVRIIKEMREATDGKYPTFALWENVPGAFSSNKGEDFRVVLEELIKIAEPSAVMPEVPPFGWAYADSYVGDGWSLAYRVFDTQYWPRTPQRRRRIYLVADFRGQRAREVLFEREGLRGHLTESPPPRERITAYVEVGPRAADCEGVEQNAVEILNSWDSQGNQVANGTGDNSFPTLRGCGGAGYQAGYVLAMATQQGGTEISDNGICPTVTAAAGMSGNNQPWICQPETAIIDNIGGQAEYGKMSEVNGTLRAGAQGAIAYSMETFHCTTEEEKVQTLKARDWKDPHVVAYGVDCRNMNEYPDLYPTLQAKPNGGQSLNFSGAVWERYIVRRLTPTECARLQGFPDVWGHPHIKESFSEGEYEFWLEVRNTYAAINGKTVKEYSKDQMLKWYNKLHSDSAEYKMWGNGIALPPSLYCMQGLAEALEGKK